MIKRLRAFVAIALACTLLLIMFPAQTAHADEKIHLSNVSLLLGRAGKLTPTITGDGTIFTFDDTKGQDIEDYIDVLAISDAVKLCFVADVDKFLYYETGNNFWGYGDKRNGDRLGFMDMQAYDTNPDYVIFTFTLRDFDGSKATLFTLRIRKWESQYEKEEQSPLWYDNVFLASTYEYGLKNVPWKAVPGKAHSYEYVAAENVTFPYTVTIRCAIHYRTKAYMDGERIYMPGGNILCEKTLTFSPNKTHYDFVIDPGTSLDSKHVTGVKSHWRVSVTGKAQSLQTMTKSRLNYSLSAKTYNGKARGVSVTPKSGAGAVTAVYYTGTNGTSYKKSTKKPTNAGSYKVTVDVAAGTKYKAATGLSLGTFQIKRADIGKIAIADMEWTGKQMRPKDFTFNKLNFTLSKNAAVKSYGANKNIGKGTIKLTGKGNFTGTKSISFKIVPKKTGISKVTAAKKQMTVQWKPVSATQKIAKYEVRYRVKGASKWTTKSYKASASSATIKGLVKGKTYQVQVRSYKTVSGQKYYSDWSATKVSGTIK